jgi:hypothetical protein
MGETMSVPYLDAACGCGCGCRCPIFIEIHKLGENETVEKVVLLNALVPVSNKSAIMVTMPASLEDVKVLVRKTKTVESFIGHEATAKLLTELLDVNIPVNRGMYKPRNWDLAIVVRLKKRLEKPEDVKNITVNDVEFLLVKYYTDVDVIS